jgi:small subunit ribosomal protein S13
VSNEQVEIALTQIFGIGLKKTIQVCYQSGLNDNIKVNKLTKYQIDQIIKIISQNYLVDSELERVIQRDIKQLMRIGCYRGFRHNVGLPLRGQRTHTNTKTCRKFRNVLINQRSWYRLQAVSFFPLLAIMKAQSDV